MLKTVGHINIVIDALYVIRGFERGPDSPHLSHVQVWATFWRVVATRPGRVRLIHGRSHRKAVDLEQGVIAPLHFVCQCGGR